MSHASDKQIHDWQEKVRQSFGDESKLYQYLFETLDNFYYRYLETGLNKNIKTKELSPGTWGAISFESHMVDALKIQFADSKAAIMDLAKSIPKAQGPQVRYQLSARVKELTADHGHLLLMAEIHCDFPQYLDSSKAIRKEVAFEYSDLAHFRKELALRLEEVCEIFL